MQIEFPDPGKLLTDFMHAAMDDPRVNCYHISLYGSLLHYWIQKKFEHPLPVFSREIMPYCKISGSGTYHRTIRELAEYGYIRYVPSYNHFLGSLVYFM